MTRETPDDELRAVNQKNQTGKAAIHALRGGIAATGPIPNHASNIQDPIGKDGHADHPAKHSRKPIEGAR